jgi:hypothetical protein
VIDASWDPTFTLRSDVFQTIADASRPFQRCAVFPTPEQIDEALASAAGVRFVRMKPVPRRRRSATVTSENMYDARIALDGVVPTRPGSWHDFLNALVWATFPRAKKALHVRQHALVVPHAPRRPPALDALALVDEGGVVISQRKKIVFGHAVYESLVRGWRPPVAAAVELACTADEVDEALAAFIADEERLRVPKDLRRVEIEDRTADELP